MTTEPLTNCRKCSRPVPPDSPLGCCPTCLAELALKQGPLKDNPAGDRPVASSAELAPYFPGLKLVKLLGSGGMGAVYLARQPKLDRDVALKILHPLLATDPEFAERFFREARVLAKLNHPNIVAVYDVDQAGPYLYLLMEYVEGATLRDLMLSGRIEAAEAMRVVPQICEAIQYAHDRGIVHRDIKPENILLNEEGTVKIADFGLAKLGGPLRDSLTSTSTRMGTVYYMAPEQAQNTAAVDHRADIYSLGVTFYEMLTGHLPTVDYQPPSKKTDVSSEVDRIVGRSLKSVPDERYQRAAEMKADVERAAFRRGRNSGMAWGITVSAAAVLVAAVTCFAFWDRQPNRNTAVADGNVQPPTPPAQIAPVILPASIESSDSEMPAKVGPSTDEVPAVGPAPAVPVVISELPPIPNVAELFTDKWAWTEPVNLGPNVNTKANESQPCLSADGLTLIFSSDRSADRQWTQDLWQCRRPNLNAAWGAAEKLPFPVNTVSFESEPSLAANGLQLAFLSNRVGGQGEMDVWISHRDTPESPWSRIENAGPTVNSPQNETLGALLDDKQLLFQSPLDPNARYFPWIARRNDIHQPFGSPANIDVGPNAENLGNPFLSSDGRVLFGSGKFNPDGRPSANDHIFVRIRTEHVLPFQEMVRIEEIGQPGFGEVGAYLSWDGKTLLFESDRTAGSQGNADIWMSQRVPVEDLPPIDPQQDYALEFDGESTIVEIPTLRLETQGPHTLEVWVRASSPTNPMQILAVGGAGGSQINLEPAGYCGGNFTLTRTKTAAAFSGNHSDWIHVAYVFDDQTGAVFLNGKEVSRVPNNGISDKAEENSTQVTWIGGYPGADGKSPQFQFRGEIDEARVSSVARYTTVFTPERKFAPDADTVALYHFAEGRGKKLEDSSGHNHHGTIRVPYWVRVAKD